MTAPPEPAPLPLSPLHLIWGPPGVDTYAMTVIRFDDTTGSWARLLRNGATVDLFRWPGPHRRGHAIHTSDGERFCFDRFDTPADGIPEAVYVATPS